MGRASWGLAVIVGAALLAQGCSGCGKPPPIPLEAATNLGPLVFPPPDGAWTDRVEVPIRPGGALRLVSPSLKEGKIEASGDVTELVFDEDVIPDPTKAPVFAISPAAPLRTVWTSPRTVELRPEKPLDPEVDYTISLPLGGFTAKLRAKLETTIAGKTVPWIPKPGEPRVVYVRPTEDKEVGPGQPILVIYDQPIEVSAAQKLVTLTDGKDRKLALSLSHPPPGQTFEGEKVDTRAVLLGRIAASASPGETMTLAAKSFKDDGASAQRTFTVAQLPKFKSVSCFDGRDCVSTEKALTGSVATGVTIKFTNGLSHGALESKVTVTPRPSNLSFGGWGEDLDVHASWAAATTYTIRIHGLVDRFGYAVPDTTVTWRTKPLSSSAILRDGVVVLDERAMRDFFVTTRNVKKGEILVWPVDPATDLREALKKAGDVAAPAGEPRVFPFDGKRDPHVYARTTFDLTGKLAPGSVYFAEARIQESAYGAEPSAYDASSGAARPSRPLLVVAGKDAIGVHAHVVGEKTLAMVYRLGTGEPVAGAEVDGGGGRATTDATGIAIVPAPAAHSEREVLIATAGTARAVLPFQSKLTTQSGELYPALASAEGEERSTELVGFVTTDKGIYRPGTPLRIKAFVRKADRDRIAPVANAKVRLRILDGNGADAENVALETSPAGTVAHEKAIASTATTGRWQIRLEKDDEKHSLLYSETVRVAEFETPRFKVDIETKDAPAGRFRARVVGHYFFGAPIQDGVVSWVIKKRPRTIDGGQLAADGFTFGREADEFDSDVKHDDVRPVIGEGKLSKDGTLDVDVALGPMPEGSADVIFEADVTDASHRHIAARKSTPRADWSHYAGLRVSRRFGELGPVKVDLAVVDASGKAVPGVAVEARLERVEWKRSTTKAESGAILEKWGPVTSTVATCTQTSDAAPRSCDLFAKKSGEYRITSRVDGHDGGSLFFYAWGGGDDSVSPTAGKKIPITTDKKKYRPGETAKVFVQSPFAEATALLTIERGELVHHETRKIKGSSAVFDVPLSAADIPFAHAVVTVLPLGAPDAAYRIGAVRLPLSLDEARLAVKVSSDRKIYDARESAAITVEVTRNGAPVRNADVTLAVVDEAILRLTDFHAKDPLAAMHVGRSLSFTAADSRQLLLRPLEKAHVAGGGGSDDADTVDTRRDFVETAAWLPALVTDDKGRVTTTVKLPDNLGEFRMMATAIDDGGFAGVAEDRFVTARPFVLDPLLPGFAVRGDKLEIGAMAHNNGDAPVNAKVKILDVTKDVRLEPHAGVRVTIPFVAEQSRTVGVAIEVDGRRRDAVEKKLTVELPGMLENPRISGSFKGSQEITVAIPEDASFDADANLVIRTGSALYPELGERLAYLRDYPHGCVEQTSSGTLPYIAAKDLIPWMGVDGLDEDAIRDRVRAGVKRLATMKTEDGALAYWPGGKEAHAYGTAYGARVLLLAKEMEIEEGDLVSDVLGWLSVHMASERDPSLRAVMAEILAKGGVLPESSADSLWDSRDKLDVFGIASLALALDKLPKQGDRVQKLVDSLEKAFDDDKPKTEHGEHDWHWWGSSDRDRAQALIALTKLRPTSKLGSLLARRLVRGVEARTTQSTAWSLLGLAVYMGEVDSPKGAVDVKVRTEGRILDTTRSLGGKNKEIAIPLAELRGKKTVLVLEGAPDTACAFAMSARYARPFDKSNRYGKRAEFGPSVHRVYTDAAGNLVDLAKIKAGDIVRVALRVELGKLDEWRSTHLAVTDRFPAGFDPVQPDLATVAEVPDIGKVHPFAEGLRSWGGQASHVDVRTDRVNVYFDSYYARTVYASYLLRAVTPGDFALPAARAELMYSPESEGYSDGGRVQIQ